MSGPRAGHAPGISVTVVERVFRVMEESGLPMDEVLAGNDVVDAGSDAYLVTFVLGDGGEVPLQVPGEKLMEVPAAERFLAVLARRQWCGLRVEPW